MSIEIDFNEAKNTFKKIRVEETLNNQFANSLLVMLNYVLESINNCKNEKVKSQLVDDFIKYERRLEGELSYMRPSKNR